MAHTRNVLLGLALLSLPLGLAACGADGKRTSRVEHPEDYFTYPVSHFVIRHNPENRGESMEKVLQAIAELESGTPFLEVARRRQTKEENAPQGGWLGFMRPETPDPMTGVCQAVHPGQWCGPFEQDQGAHFVFRHTFEEGREIESDLVIPAYGFIVPNDPDSPVGDVEQRAQELWEKVERGEMTLAEASEPLGSSAPRSDAFLGNVVNRGPQQELYAVLEKVDPGELAPLTPVRGALLFVRRGIYFRSHVRHVLIQHIESKNRPLSVSRPKEEAKALAEKVLAELRDGTLVWNDAVKRYSDEVQTLALHGWIGAVTNGDLIPEFERAIVATEPGEFADEILESGDGFHVIYRVN